MTPLETALLEVTSLLDQQNVPYMVIGGLAVSLWGEPRATLDVDITVSVEPDKIEAFLAALGRRLRHVSAEPLGFLRQTRVLPVLTEAGVRVDLVFAGLSWEAEAIGRARPRPVAGKQVMVASVEDLVLMKLVSERERDSDDARRLLRRFRATLDRAYLEPRLAELAEALGRPDILTLFRRA